MSELSLANLTLHDSNIQPPSNTTHNKPKLVKASPLLIPELLELILVSLPPLEVLTTWRTVCRLWRDIIDTSPVLKFSTWRAESIPGRQAPKVTTKSYQRNPLVLEILSNFWIRLNTFDDSPLQENPEGAEPDWDLPPQKRKKKKSLPQIDIPSFLSHYTKICNTLIFSNSPPLDITIRITVQKYASKHIIARSYRSISTDIGIGWIKDLDVLMNLMDEIVKLRNEGVYVGGKRNTMQAEIGWCVFLYPHGGENAEGGWKRRECEVVEKVDFECVEPWGVLISQVGRVREVSGAQTR
ncbi:hypothetical protein TWF481_010973 [Arthrobotrys musiformis]|uniref:F-box domain-containing protein n=1 Tax=Arthrobotrys musiformis TaxID=47236 RepID=A0AAV9VX78_9PEZI